MPKIFFLKNEKEFIIEAPIGMSVLEAAQDNNIDLDGNCGGSLACGTCHVIVKEKWLPLLEEPIEAEEDLLDIVFGVTKNSRLACQIIMTEKLDGIEILIP